MDEHDLENTCELDQYIQQRAKRSPDFPRIVEERRAVRENRRLRYLKSLQEDNLDNQR